MSRRTFHFFHYSADFTTLALIVFGAKGASSVASTKPNPARRPAYWLARRSDRLRLAHTSMDEWRVTANEPPVRLLPLVAKDVVCCETASGRLRARKKCNGGTAFRSPALGHQPRGIAGAS